VAGKGLFATRQLTPEGAQPVAGGAVVKPRKSGNLDLFKCADLGLRLAVALGLGAYGGHKLDQWLHIEPFGLVGGCFLGLAVGLTHVIMTVNALSSEGGDDAP
jgi:F0F1-type ATP synthase assembly protein I